MTCGLKFKLCTSCLEICHMNKVSIKQNQYYTFVFTLESKHELFCVIINHAFWQVLSKLVQCCVAIWLF